MRWGEYDRFRHLLPAPDRVTVSMPVFGGSYGVAIHADTPAAAIGACRTAVKAFMEQSPRLLTSTERLASVTSPCQPCRVDGQRALF